MLKLHSLISDHAVLQAGKPILISGTAGAGGVVLIALGGETQQATAGADGRWSAGFAARPPGVSLELKVACGAESVTCSDLVTGEVWLCSGQSNMEWTLGATKGAEEEVASAHDPLIRCFTVPRLNVRQPAAETSGTWKLTTPENTPNFSAVAWFFARRLREQTGVPVGLIVSAWGGSCIAPWIPRASLEARACYKEFLAEVDSKPAAIEENSWIPYPVRARTEIAAGWEQPGFDDADWPDLKMPGTWQDQGWRFNGAVWYRANLEIPEAWRGRKLVLTFGPVDDFDDTYVNGARVGGLGPETANAYSLPRIYEIPAALVKASNLTIAVRVMDIWGKGGIMGAGRVSLAEDPAQSVALPKVWKARAEFELPWRMGGGGMAPTELYNGMIHPLLGYPLRGFLWYQGESDAGRAQRYRVLMPDLIAACRRLWMDPVAPFGIVQLANYMPVQPEPVESEWAELRDAQRLTANTVPHVGLASAIDLGEENDIHPRFKKPVGDRLARWALATVYGQYAGAWAHPDLADCGKTPGAILVRLAHCADGLRARGGNAIRGFQIAGDDRVWRWAEAERTEFDTVRVRSPHVADPVAVRYAWQNNPDANLENSEGLPALPFRTDDWVSG